jgi:pimeloyl-ACP methyl ester carboxylesterase
MAKDTRILIIHGWSDCSDSFAGIKSFLTGKNIGQVNTIYYADYESREDSLTYNDIVEGLNDNLIKQGIIKNDGTSDYNIKIIVHSTGGLVVRHWLWRYYHECGNLANCPVTNLVMLVPANFGSPLAQMGKSFLGELVKGRWKVGDFLEVGRQLLNGLELASEYQWQLAHRDLFIADNYFNRDKIRATILVGDTDYTGARGWFNKPGTDGTVVISGTNLDTVKLTLRFAKPKNDPNNTYLPHEWVKDTGMSDTAYGILEGYNHGSIVDNVSKDKDAPYSVSNVILRALSDSKEDFVQLKKDLNDYTNDLFSKTGKDKYQQFNVRAVDNQGSPVRDFTLEFSVYKKENVTTQAIPIDQIPDNDVDDDEYAYSTKLNTMVMKEVHPYSADTSYRRLLVNHRELMDFVTTLTEDPNFKNGFIIGMRIYVPAIDKGINYVLDNLQHIVIHDSTATDDGVPSFFYENTTTLMELQVDRKNSYVTVQTEPRKH